MVDKSSRRTTIEMPEALYKRIKALAIEKDMTLRELITEALEEKIEKESKGTESSHLATKGSLSYALLSTMEKFITREAAITLLTRKCEQYGYDPLALEYEDIDEKFLKELCQSMLYISYESEDACFDALKSAMEGF